MCAARFGGCTTLYCQRCERHVQGGDECMVGDEVEIREKWTNEDGSSAMICDFAEDLRSSRFCDETNARVSVSQTSCVSFTSARQYRWDSVRHAHNAPVVPFFPLLSITSPGYIADITHLTTQSRARLAPPPQAATPSYEAADPHQAHSHLEPASSSSLAIALPPAVRTLTTARSPRVK